MRSGARLLRGGGGASGLFVVDAEHRQAGLRPRRAHASARSPRTRSCSRPRRCSRRFGPEARLATKVLADGEIDREGDPPRQPLPAGRRATRRSARPPSTTRYLGGLGTNLYALKRQVRAAGDQARSPAASTPTTRSSTACAASPTPATRRAPKSARSPASTSTPASPTPPPAASPPTRRGWPPRSCAPSLARLGVSSQPRRSRSATPDEQSADARSPSVDSPTIGALVNTTDVDSNNFFAEMLLKLLGAALRRPAAPPPPARTVVEQFAAAKGTVDPRRSTAPA